MGTKKGAAPGAGSAVTADLTQWAFDQGATLSTLEATEMAVGANRALGYRELGLTYRTYWHRSAA